jgi:cell division transport system permease protein
MNEIIKSIKRTPYQSLAIFLILFFTLFLSTIIFISLTFFYSFLNYVETRPQVTVYFQNKASTEQIFKLRDELVSSGKVLSIKYISKGEAFKIYKDLNKDNPLLLEMVTSDILPASLEIYAQKPYFAGNCRVLKKTTWS